MKYNNYVDYWLLTFMSLQELYSDFVNTYLLMWAVGYFRISAPLGWQRPGIVILEILGFLG